MLQESSAFVVSLDSDEEIPESEWIAATQRDDDTLDEASKLMHARTLTLGETAEDDGILPSVPGHSVAHADDSAETKAAMERIRLENLKLQEELAELRRLKSTPLTSPTNQKPVFTPEATPTAHGSSAAASPEAGQAAAPGSSAAASPEADQADAADGNLKLGEEELAEVMDLSHKDMVVILGT